MASSEAKRKAGGGGGGDDRETTHASAGEFAAKFLTQRWSEATARHRSDSSGYF